MTPSWFALAGALLSLCLSPCAQAQETRDGITARFSAPPGCGDRSVLERRFEDRVPELQMSFTQDAAVRFTLEKNNATIRARLLILLEEGGELSRTIEADDCEAAIEAIAFIAAVALDPGADDPLQLRSQERLVPDKAVPRQEEKPKEAETEQRRALPPSAPRSWTGGISGNAQLGAAPEFLWGGGLSLENSSRASSWWAPSARIALGYTRRGGFQEDFGTARFQLATARLDLCPSQARGDIFRVQLCGTMEGGLLLAEGLATFQPTRSTRPWLGAGPSLFSEIMIAGPVGLSYRAGAIFPLIRDSFRFQDTVFHEVPVVTLELQAGLSVRF